MQKEIIPPGFVEEISNLLGPKADALVSALDEAPSVSYRINNKKISDASTVAKSFLPIESTPVPWCPDGFYLSSRPEFILNPLLHAGVFYVQEAASMVYQTIVSDLLSGMDAPVRVLDLCAAPGGKSTAMLNALSGDYLLVANEYDRQRVRILRENLDKWGDPNVIITSTNAESFGRLSGFFDIVAVDAPCSGEGMMRREPVARSQWSEGLVNSCALMQRDILADVAPALAPGGYLIYSTCTFNTRENEANCRYIIEELGFRQVRDPERFMPHERVCEGLFVAVFRKPEDVDVSALRRAGRASATKYSPDWAFVKPDGMEFRRYGDTVFAMPEAVASAVDILQANGIKPLSAGVETGNAKGNLILPSSRQLLSTAFDRNSIPLVELGAPTAMDFLRRNSPVLQPDTPKGYVGLTYGGYPLGLVKNLGTRTNTLHPSEWRVVKG